MRQNIILLIKTFLSTKTNSFLEQFTHHKGSGKGGLDMGVSSSVNNDKEAYKDFDKDRDKGVNYYNKAGNNGAINGINTPSTGYTVGQISGINRSKQPYSSGIYTVTIEAPRRESNIFAMEKSNILSFRRYRKLHIHRLDAIVEVNNIDKDTVVGDLLKLLNYETPKERHTTGKAFTTWVYREKRGESITISLNHKTGTYTVRITTHKTKRLQLFQQYIYGIGVEKLRALMIETYVRYLERYELKIAKTLEALDVELGKSLKQHLIPNRGKHDYYLSRAKIEYRGATVVLKTYRYRNYRQHKPTDPEYHPKLEQLTILKDLRIPIELDKTIKEYSTLLHTIAWTINVRVILGEYELNETETIEVSSLDKTIQKYIRGVIKRIKAEIILEEQYPDKRIAIAKLLVEKKMKPSEIAKILGYSKMHIYRIIQELLDSGVIKRAKRGVYEWGSKRAKLEKPRIVETRQMTLKQLIEFTKETRAKIVHDKGTLVVEYEDEYTKRRIIVSNILVEEDRIIEQLEYTKRYYKIPRNRLRQLLET
jgi:predicted transcriptional regulator